MHNISFQPNALAKCEPLRFKTENLELAIAVTHCISSFYSFYKCLGYHRNFENNAQLMLTDPHGKIILSSKDEDSGLLQDNYRNNKLTPLEKQRQHRNDFYLDQKVTYQAINDRGETVSGVKFTFRIYNPEHFDTICKVISSIEEHMKTNKKALDQARADYFNSQPKQHIHLKDWR